MAPGLVVVGVDGSPASQVAADWAIDVAGRCGSSLEVVHAWWWNAAAFGAVVPEVPSRLAEAAQATADAQLAKVLAARPAGAPEVRARARSVEGEPGQVLVSAAASADLLVLARHGQSTLSRRLVGQVLGSVAGHCLNRSAAPVVVVPADASPGAPGRVVVGVDGSDSGARALRWALAHADAVGAKVDAVLAWQLTTLPAPSSWTGGAVPELPAWEAHAVRLLQSACEAAVPADRLADVQQIALHQPAAAGLLGAVGPADLLVLGERGRGGFARLLLGSVSRQCAEHAPCPVVVVPPGDRSPAATA